jgi:CRISPR/Cas system-associated exonuclease Cas4 (RecB family)
MFKELRTVPLIRGDLISKIINEVLKEIQAPEINHLKKLFEKEMKETLDKGDRKVTELHNGLPISESYFQKHIEGGKKGIEYFVTKVYPKLKVMEIKKVDKKERYEIGGRFFYSAPDLLAVDTKGVWHVIDWKTGAGDGTKESLLEMQLTTYAFYTINCVLNGRRSDIRLHAVFLQDPSKNVNKDLTEEMLDHTKRWMFERHDLLLERSMNGPFSANPEERKCQFCNFVTICD